MVCELLFMNSIHTLQLGVSIHRETALFVNRNVASVYVPLYETIFFVTYVAHFFLELCLLYFAIDTQKIQNLNLYSINEK